MEQPHMEEIFTKGIDALENGHIYLALSCFEQATAMEYRRRVVYAARLAANARIIRIRIAVQAV